MSEPAPPPDGQLQGVRHGAGSDTNVGATFRVCLLALLIAPLNAIWVVQMDGVRSLGMPTLAAPFFNVVFIISVAVAVNGAMRRLLPRFALSHAELVVLYVLMSVLTSGVGYDTVNFTFATATGAYRYGTPESGWREAFFEYLPSGMLVEDADTLDRLWAGGAGDPAHRWSWSNLAGPWARPECWRGVVGPMVRWWVFLSALWLAPMGLAVIFRYRWIEAERLTFPITYLPLEMSRPDAWMFRHRYMWAGFGLAAGISLLNGLHVLYPTVPQIPIRLEQVPILNLGNQLTDRPWNAVGWFWLCFYPFVIGLGLLLPLELPLSCALFYVFFKAQLVFFAWLGMTQKPEFPYQKEQSYGGYVALLVFSLVAGRHYYIRVAKQVIGLVRMPVDRSEPMSYRAAAGLFVGGAAYVVLVGVQQHMAWWVSALFFAQYFLLTAIIGRIRAETGIPSHEIERLGPTVMLGNILGARILGPRNLTGASVFFGFTRGMRNIPFPHQAEGLKFAERLGMPSRRLMAVMMAAVPVGLAVGIWAHYDQVFRYGYAATWRPVHGWACREAWDQLVAWINTPAGFHTGRATASALGFLFYYGMMLLRTRVLWWPIHPIGFALSSTWCMHHMWFPFLIAATIKWLLARYAGHTSFRGLAAFALGLILGDIGFGCLWQIYGIIKGVPVWAFWP